MQAQQHCGYGGSPSNAERDTVTAPLLRLTDVSYTYGSYLALNQVSFDVEAGQLVVLAGRNGAGKTTLLRCIAGWNQVTQGQVDLMGTSIYQAERSMRRNLILVPDTPPFYNDLTVGEHLQFIAQVNRLANWRGTAQDLLKRFGLTASQAALPAALSRGQRYKLALCMALLVDPQLLLLDEPFGPLDPFSAHQLWDDLWARRGRGKAVLLSSHQSPLNVRPDRYLFMEGGDVVADGTPDDLMDALHAGSNSLDDLLRATIEHAERQAPAQEA
ncbi:MAG: ABC transporter ATP-binding protein [Chloroflexi bacterium]|nr:ABC transporter ATP-binding protein [Chloroflexota bacterium]